LKKHIGSKAASGIKSTEMKAVKEMYNNYRGQLKRDRMEGCGAYQFESGATFEGNFKNGMFHGKGRCIAKQS